MVAQFAQAGEKVTLGWQEYSGDGMETRQATQKELDKINIIFAKSRYILQAVYELYERDIYSDKKDYAGISGDRFFTERTAKLREDVAKLSGELSTILGTPHDKLILSGKKKLSVGVNILSEALPATKLCISHDRSNYSWCDLAFKRLSQYLFWISTDNGYWSQYPKNKDWDGFPNFK